MYYATLYLTRQSAVSVKMPEGLVPTVSICWEGSHHTVGGIPQAASGAAASTTAMRDIATHAVAVHPKSRLLPRVRWVE